MTQLQKSYFDEDRNKTIFYPAIYNDYAEFKNDVITSHISERFSIFCEIYNNEKSAEPQLTHNFDGYLLRNEICILNCLHDNANLLNKVMQYENDTTIKNIINLSHILKERFSTDIDVVSKLDKIISHYTS